VQSESNVCDTAAEKRLVIVVCQRFVQAMHDDAENLATEYEHLYKFIVHELYIIKIFFIMNPKI
jgi:hypothetical protein